MDLRKIRKLILTSLLVLTVMFVTGGFRIYDYQVWNICPFGAMQDIIIQFSKQLLLLILATVLLSLILGRAFCGWLCPFGALINFMSTASGRKKVFTKYIKYGVLILSLIGAYLLLDPIFCSFCPAGCAFDIIGEGRDSIIPEVRYLLLGLILVGTFAFGRFWCTTLCPLGGALSLLGSLSIFRLRVGNQCTKCGRCNEVCEMNIDVMQERGMNECSLCWECVEECPYKTIKLKFILQD